MIYLNDAVSLAFSFPEFNPLYALLMVPIIGLFFFTTVRGKMRGTESQTSPKKNFRFEITGFENESVQIGLFTAEWLSGEDISSILTTALPIIAKKDPDLMKLLLYHCLEALEGDEEINKALVNFHKDVNQSLSNF